MSLDRFLAFRQEASRAKWRKTLIRRDPPPFLGPLVSIKEAMESLNRSKSYICNRIEDGRLNTWKDPVSRRVWILKDDLDILLGDNQALEEKGKLRGGKPRPKPESAATEDESEDLDAIGGWEHPKPPPVVPGAAIEESIRESNLRYDQKVRENEEWYAAELAKLEGRDPEEAVRQLRIERGWITPEPDAPGPAAESFDPPMDSFDSVYDAAKALATTKTPRRKNHSESRPVIRPISYSDPNPRPRTPPEPYIDSESNSLLPDDPIIPPFPIGWISMDQVANILDLTKDTIWKHYIRKGKLHPRKNPKDGRAWLFDSLEVERLAEQRLGKPFHREPGHRFDWWGSRAKKMELAEFDYWISTREAAGLLGVTPDRICELCKRGLLPCYQKSPGKGGSRIYVPQFHVQRLANRPDYQRKRAEWNQSRDAADTHEEQWEEKNIEPYRLTDETANTRRDYGDVYSTRQVARLLKISVGAVHSLRRRGRLEGMHTRPKKPGTAGRQRWFFKKEDVHNLQAEPEYIRHHKRYKKQFDKAWQDDPEPEPAAPPSPPATSAWSWDDSDLPTW
jgi:hypothetical protein